MREIKKDLECERERKTKSVREIKKDLECERERKTKSVREIKKDLECERVRYMKERERERLRVREGWSCMKVSKARMFVQSLKTNLGKGIGPSGSNSIKLKRRHQ